LLESLVYPTVRAEHVIIRAVQTISRKGPDGFPGILRDYTPGVSIETKI